MASKDHSEEEDYYSQDFEREGIVSVWAGCLEYGDDTNIDVLQELCGVGYYRIDDQENNCFDYQLVRIEQLLAELSYSKSFCQEAASAAREKQVGSARWVVVQYDFAYDPVKVSRKVSEDPVFVGCFPYVAE